MTQTSCLWLNLSSARSQTHRFSPLNLFCPFDGDLPYKRISRKAISPLSSQTQVSFYLVRCALVSFPEANSCCLSSTTCFTHCVCACVCVCEHVKGLDSPITHSIPPECELQPWATRLPSSYRTQTHTHGCSKNPASCSWFFTHPASKEGNLMDSQLDPSWIADLNTTAVTDTITLQKLEMQFKALRRVYRYCVWVFYVFFCKAFSLRRRASQSFGGQNNCLLALFQNLVWCLHR